jgi:hypothetical protein
MNGGKDFNGDSDIRNDSALPEGPEAQTINV